VILNKTWYKEYTEKREKMVSIVCNICNRHIYADMEVIHSEKCKQLKAAPLQRKKHLKHLMSLQD